MPIRLYAVVLIALVGCEQPSAPEPADSPTEASRASSAAAESPAASATSQAAEGESPSDESSDNSPEKPSKDSSAQPVAKGDAPPSQATAGDADGESSAASGGDNPMPDGASARPQGVASHRRFGTPSEAATFAQGRFDDAKSMWEPKAAIQTALEGWQAVNQHEGDPKCRTLAEQLLAEMQRRDRQAGSAKKGDSLNDLPLQIK